MNKYLIMEAASPANASIIEENFIPGGGSKIIFRAILQDSNVVNNNKRIYPPETLQEIVRQLAPKAQARKLLGEMDHPQPQGDSAAKLKRSSTILLQNVCVLFRKLEFTDGKIVAECETLSNRAGQDLVALLKDNAVFGFSLRAFGETRDRGNGIVEVVPQGLKALTFDVVANPSHDTAVIEEFLTESTDYKEVLKLIQEMKDYSNELEKVNAPKILEEANTLFDEIRAENSKCLKESGAVKTVCINGICMRQPLEEAIDYLVESSIINFKKPKQVKFNF